jgi:hypothetical protein
MLSGCIAVLLPWTTWILVESIYSANPGTSYIVQATVRKKRPVHVRVCLNFSATYEYRKYVELTMTHPRSHSGWSIPTRSCTVPQQIIRKFFPLWTLHRSRSGLESIRNSDDSDRSVAVFHVKKKELSL